MDITISMFEAHQSYMIAARTIRMMDMGQSTLYAQLTVEGKNKIWNSWDQALKRVTQIMNNVIGQTPTLTWNGEPITKDNLKRQFMLMFGRRSIER